MTFDFTCFDRGPSTQMVLCFLERHLRAGRESDGGRPPAISEESGVLRLGPHHLFKDYTWDSGRPCTGEPPDTMHLTLQHITAEGNIYARLEDARGLSTSVCVADSTGSPLALYINKLWMLYSYKVRPLHAWRHMESDYIRMVRPGWGCFGLPPHIPVAALDICDGLDSLFQGGHPSLWCCIQDILWDLDDTYHLLEYI